jgi:hypothetical protein
VRVLSKLFRRLMIEKLVAAHATGQLTFHGAHAALVNTKAFAAHLAPLKRTRWFVYAKRPFAGPKAVSPIWRATPIVWRSRTGG